MRDRPETDDFAIKKISGCEAKILFFSTYLCSSGILIALAHPNSTEKLHQAEKPHRL